MLIFGFNDINRVMRKPDFCICKNKVAYPHGRTAYTDSKLPLLPKSEPLSHLHWPYSPNCVRPGRKPKGCFFFVSWLKLYALKSKRGTQSALVDTDTRLDSLTSDMSFRTKLN